MAKIHSKHEVSFQLPPIMAKFAEWLGERDDNAVGYLELTSDPPGEGFFENKDEEQAFQKAALLFARTPDGSEIVLINRGPTLPCPVVLLNSEGGEETIAVSVEEFLLLLAKGETGVFDLDDEDATERKALAAWLKKMKVKAIKAPPFDLGEFLEGKDASAGETSAAALSPPPPPSGDGYDKLPDRARRLALLVGRPASDPELVALVTAELGKKVPASLSWSKDYEWVEASKKHGIDLLFESHIHHDAYPEIQKSKSSFVPYLSGIYFREQYKEPLPFGVTWGLDDAALEALIGPPTGIRPKNNIRYWRCPIDPGRGLIFFVQGSKDRSLRIDSALELASPVHPSKQIVGLFVAWALSRDLLDVSRFSAHAALIERIKAREAKGSDLVEGALSRGLWDRHLKALPGLGVFAFGWFHNQGGNYIRDDLVAVFGGRVGEHGHNEPILDDDTWEAVDMATAKLDGVFANWLK